jgi:hypothetical protein
VSVSCHATSCPAIVYGVSLCFLADPVSSAPSTPPPRCCSLLPLSWACCRTFLDLPPHSRTHSFVCPPIHTRCPCCPNSREENHVAVLSRGRELRLGWLVHWTCIDRASRVESSRERERESSFFNLLFVGKYTAATNNPVFTEIYTVLYFVRLLSRLSHKRHHAQTEQSQLCQILPASRPRSHCSGPDTRSP